MAEQLKLVRHYVMTDVEDSLDLRFAGGSGVWVTDEGWVPKVGDREMVTEVLRLTVKGTTRDDLAAKLQSVEARLEQIRQFTQATPEKYYVMLRHQVLDEDKPREAWIAGYSVELSETLHKGPLVVEGYRLGLDRPPWWQSPDRVLVSLTSAPISCWGGYQALGLPPTVGVRGSMPAHISETAISASNCAVNEIWGGFRTARFGTLANFVCPWLCGAASSLGSDTSLLMGIGWMANTVRTTFATHPEMDMRFKLKASDISPTHYDDQRGTFDIIGLMFVDSDTTAAVRMDNYLGMTMTSIGRTILVNSTTPRLYNLGRITWPPTGRIMSQVSVTPAWSQVAVQLNAQRVSGSGSMRFMYLIPIPVDEGYFHVSGANIYYTSTTDYQLATLIVNPLGQVQALQRKRITSPNTEAIYTPLDVRGTSLDTFHLPVSTATNLVIAAQTASPDAADTLTINFYAHERFKTLRGAA